MSLTFRVTLKRSERALLAAWLAECTDISAISGRVRLEEEELFLRVDF